MSAQQHMRPNHARAPRLPARPGLGAWLMGAALALGASAFVSPAMAQGVVRSTHGDWQMRCETPPGARTEQCALVQNVAAEDRPNVTLLVIALWRF